MLLCSFNKHQHACMYMHVFMHACMCTHVLLWVLMDATLCVLEQIYSPSTHTFSFYWTYTFPPFLSRLSCYQIACVCQVCLDWWGIRFSVIIVFGFALYDWIVRLSSDGQRGRVSQTVRVNVIMWYDMCELKASRNFGEYLWNSETKEWYFVTCILH